MMITFKLNPQDLTCTIYQNGEELETIPMVGRVARLKELGYDFAAASKKLTTSTGNYGWGATRSAGIRRGV